jgi:hypothetical protein
MAFRHNYWSCTKFADWVRGTAKPGAATAEGWNDWQKTASTAHKIRYWIAEEALDRIQNFLNWPLDKLYDIKYYINNRWVTRTNALTAHPSDIKPGSWRDVGNRFLPCLFNELANYVEIELAWWHVAWDREAREKFGSPWWSWGWFRWRTWRSPEAGLANLEWQSNLVWEEDHCAPGSPNIGKPTKQAENAKEILALYKWWKEVYPNRPDPHDVSGWTAYCTEAREKNSGNKFSAFLGETDPEKAELRTNLVNRSVEIEEQYTQEDTEMLIRLIRIRDSLWT